MMKNIFYILIAAFSLILHAKCVGQNNIVYGAGISYTNGVPTFVPPSKSARVAIDTATSKWYEYATPGGWRWSGDRVQDISGCAAPAYTPGKAQSRLVLNSCTVAQNGHGPEMYKYTGSAWLCLNCGGNYTAGVGIDITGTEITNTAPDQVVSITGSGTNAVTGTYPNFTVTGTEVDGSTTNELQTLSVAGSNLSISGGNTVTLPTPSSTLDALTDVTITSPTNNQILQYNTAGSQWVNATLAGITGSGVSGQVAVFNGTSTITGPANANDFNVTDVGRFQVVGANGNGPVSGSLYYGIHIPLLAPWATNYGFQIAGRNTGMFYRNLQNGTWEPWYQVLSDQNINASVVGDWNVGNASRKFTLVGGSVNGPGTIAFGASFPHTVDNYNLQIAGRIRRFWARANENGTYSTWTRIATGLPVSGNVPYWGANAGTNGDTLATSTSLNYTNGNLRIGSASAAAARIDVTSTTSGALFPRMTATQRDAIASPPVSLELYNTTSGRKNIYTTQWETVISGVQYTPTGSADSAGVVGSFSWDNSYMYFKTATGWKRTALSTF